ncbi:MAG TPA: hypothetical protein VH539_12595, partial [Gemmatimonadaceae bacterium]
TVTNAGSGNITGVTTSISVTTGRASASWVWLQASIASTVPQTGTALTLTLQHTNPDSLGDFSVTVTVSALNMVSKTLTVNYHRQATMAGDIWPILHDSAIGTTKCVNCHSLPTSPSMVDFSSASQAQGSLVSPTFNGKVYVVTGDSAGSYLYQILNGTAAASGYPNMPSTCTPTNNTACLGSQLRTRIYIWIMQGASP